MITITSSDIPGILAAHAKWLRSETGGSRADLSGANLSGANLFRATLSRATLSRADLSGADLSGANLSGANLFRATLSRATLSRADLSGADLSGANLSGATLSRATLSRADLSGADLSGANLSRADLSGADLSGANLFRANLSGADLSGANLFRANLFRANLSGADLSGAKNAELVIAQTRILPEGHIVGYKMLRDGIIATLNIPAAAKRSHAFGRKCRAEYAEVTALSGDAKIGYSKHDHAFSYSVGQTVRPDKWDENWQEECAGGVINYHHRGML